VSDVLAGPGRLIVISGPSGVGKDTVLDELFGLDDGLRYSVSYTTRARRPGEREDESYSFVDERTFRDMEQRGEFLESAVVHGRRYGTALQRVRDAVAQGHDVVLKIDVQGAAQVRERVGGSALFIFLLPPSLEELRRRPIQAPPLPPPTVTRLLNRAFGDAVARIGEIKLKGFTEPTEMFVARPADED